ncbi:MAG: 4Fe-4S dicluster domain-containing protein [Candidatus Aminicenantes bacterium]|nr:4Fe-4S dicluster domain-containing protein [Candidatus Aminicenantes bacterium]
MDIQRKVKYENELDTGFLQRVKQQSHCDEIERCIQCGTCSSSCPMSVYMDHPPRQIIGFIKNGFRDEALKSFTVWLCSSCYTCQVRCPSMIKITDVMYAVRREAIENKAYPRRFSIPVLDKEMTRLIARDGRNSEMRLILRLYLKSFKPLSLLKMTPLGWKLLKTGRMGLKRNRIKDRKQLRALVKAIKENGK